MTLTIGSDVACDPPEVQAIEFRRPLGPIDI